MRIALFLHLISDVVWVGGMFLAYVVVRPAAVEALEAPQRLRLWVGILRRFFAWAGAAAGLILLTGFTMLAGMTSVPRSVLLMTLIGIVMAGVYLYVLLIPFAQLKRAVGAEDWKAGGAALGAVRKLVALNLSLGVVNIAVAALGPAI
jgi:uncharacterized membrane protein